MTPSTSLTPINKIIPLSVVDGPGCRTSIFVQGCNISCSYCHNPETQQLCRGCGVCVDQCPAGALSIEKKQGAVPSNRVVWNERICIQCDKCIHVCPYYSSPKVRRMSVEDVWKEIEGSLPFIQGITVSGGECSLYPEFLTELYRKAGKAGLTCFSDCNGCVDLSQYPNLMAATDKVMLDVKAWDSHVFTSLTGGDGSAVKKNLVYLAKNRKLYEVRLVCLDLETDMEAVIRGVAAQAAPFLKDFRLKLIAFRSQGVKGRLEKRESPSPGRMEELKNLAVRCGFSHIQTV